MLEVFKVWLGQFVQAGTIKTANMFLGNVQLFKLPIDRTFSHLITHLSTKLYSTSRMDLMSESNWVWIKM